MKAETREYILGERNATRDEFILSRESTGNAEYVSVSLPGYDEPIYALWTKKPQKKKATQATGEIVKPKHTGGKRPYIMLMQDQDDAINQLSLDAAGLVFKLLAGGFVEWNTGRIIDRRTKKPLTIKMIHTRYKLGVSRTKKLMKELTEAKIIKYDRKKRSYFFNTKLARKGAGSNAD